MFANTSQEYAYILEEKFSNRETEECYIVLDEWKRDIPSDYPTIQALKATVLLSEGRLEESFYMMKRVLPMIDGTVISERQANIIRNVYIMSWNYKKLEESCDQSRFYIYPLSIWNKHTKEMKERYKGKKHSSGTKIKYFSGFASILLGIILEPVTMGGSTVLITTGVSFLSDAIPAMVDDYDKWDNECTIEVGHSF